LRQIIPVELSRGGRLTLAGHGQYLYQPDSGFIGTDPFPFSVTGSGAPAGGDQRWGYDAPKPSLPATVTLNTGKVVDLDDKRRARFTDADGGLVTVTLKGSGTGELRFADSSPGVVKQDVSGIVVAGTLGSLLLGGVADAHTIAIGGSAQDKPVKIVLGRVQDTALISQTPVKSLTVTDWLETDGLDDLVQAPWIGKVATKGTKSNPKKGVADVAGDFEANVVLNVAGDVDDVAWAFGGSGR